MKTLFIATLAALCVLAGCSSKSRLADEREPTVSYVQVKNPERELCTDDTLSPVEWINVPFARFANSSLELNGRTVSEQELRDWAAKYYRTKVERGLWVEVSPESEGNAEHALLPLLRLYPDLQLRRVQFGFTCPKLQK
ncbi:MAG: hypothetical protein WBW69_10785 [Candidatus Korobacteraceae bacterium]